MTTSPPAEYGADFFERISATAIVNQAVIKCTIAGVPVTQDNVIFFVGDFADPAKPQHARLISEISRTIEEVFAVSGKLKLVASAPN